MTTTRRSFAGGVLAKRVYEQVAPGEWYEPPLRAHFEGCCDCGLTHKNEYRVLDRAGNVITGVRVQMRCWRDERKTAAVRRGMRAKLIGFLRGLVGVA
jgi:hypothetical protein